MKRCHIALAFLFAGIEVFYFFKVAHAFECSKVVVPVFAASIDSQSEPKPPQGPLSQEALERFRVQLDLYRKNTVEGYNAKLIAYGNTLNRFDKDLRGQLARGKCSQEQYDDLKQQISDQLEKVSSEYTAPYQAGLTTYSEYMGWYKGESRRLKIKKQLDGLLLDRIGSENWQG